MCVIHMPIVCTRMSLCMSFVSHSYVLACHWYVTYVPVYYLYVLVYHSYVTRMYSCVIRMWLVCGFTMNHFSLKSKSSRWQELITQHLQFKLFQICQRLALMIHTLWRKWLASQERFDREIGISHTATFL